MSFQVDTALLRQQSRSEDFCHSIDPQYFKQIIDFLLETGRTDADKQHLLASISNILLINRTLHTSYFTPNFSGPLLKYLNDYLFALVPEELCFLQLNSAANYSEVTELVSSSSSSTSNSIPPPKYPTRAISADSFDLALTKSSQSATVVPNSLKKPTTALGSTAYARQDETHRFEWLIAPYRLIFLILYDDIAQSDAQILDNTFKTLYKGLNFCLNDNYHPQNMPDLQSLHISNNETPANRTNFNYLIQVDDDANDHYNMENHIYNNIYPQNQYHVLATIEILKGLYSFYHKNQKYIDQGKSLLPYLIRLVILLGAVIDTLDNNQHLLLKNLLNVVTIILTHSGNVEYYKLPIYQHFSKVLMNLLHHRLMVYIETDVSEINDISSLFILITFLSKEFRRHTCRTALDEFKAKIIPTDENVPIIYNECLQLISRPSGSFDSNKLLQEEMTISHLKQLIIECIFELSWKPVEEDHFIAFLESVGYVYGKSYLLSNQLLIPAAIDANDYFKPKYFKNDTDNIPRNGTSTPFDISQSFKTILSSHESQPKINIEMTDDEKEREAEKLFTIFDRMEKTGVFQNFSNPVREWQQLGKFESLPEE